MMLQVTREKGKHLTIALAGNANVGKSVIFNQLTGASQHIGNWPGKTVERAEGKLYFDGYEISVIDLPGIYSFATYSPEELIAREYIAFEKPDVVINIVDASVLERNLFFTLQLMELNVPLVICLNQMDIAKKQGILIDVRKLEEILGVPAVPTVAIKGEGIRELIEVAIDVAERRRGVRKAKIRYGAEVESKIEGLSQLIESEKIELGYPSRWVAIKLLEGDPEVRRAVVARSERAIHTSEAFREEIERIHEEPCFAVISSERYSQANMIANEVQLRSVPRITLPEKLDWILTHKMVGYLTSAGILAGLLFWTFTIGSFLAESLSGIFGLIGYAEPILAGSVADIMWSGVYGGLLAGITLAIPYLIPFYLAMAMLEDSGILTRVAFMMDGFMHRLGLHGKSIIPFVLGYGCNVPAIHVCRSIETRRERLLTAFAITFAPCSARTIVILGLVAACLGVQWALALYAIDLLIVFMIGKIAFKVVPGEPSGLVMEMHALRFPFLKVVAKQMWTRTKYVMYFAFPIYIIGSALAQLLYSLGVLDPINDAMGFIITQWLGLPAIVTTFLIFGLIRKELVFLAPVAIYGTKNLTLFMTSAQLVTLAIVAMLHFPCLSTIAMLAKEYGKKVAAVIAIANLVVAMFVGGIAFRLLFLVL